MYYTDIHLNVDGRKFKLNQVILEKGRTYKGLKRYRVFDKPINAIIGECLACVLETDLTEIQIEEAKKNKASIKTDRDTYLGE